MTICCALKLILDSVNKNIPRVKATILPLLFKDTLDFFQTVSTIMEGALCNDYITNYCECFEAPIRL